MTINTNCIKIAMIEKNLTVTEVANTINVNNNTVSRWINGKNLNNIESFINMMLLLDIDIKKLKE